MIDPNVIKKRLNKDYEHVKTFVTDTPAEPIFFACNFEDDTFMVVTIFMDAEIGGKFTLEESTLMEYVHDHFDAEQADDLRKVIISQIESGDATVVGAPDPKKLH
jgi:hypothetical protein